MTELDITDFFNGAAPSDYSASRMELGEDAGTITWRNACDAAYPLLKTEDEREAFRDFVQESGGWKREEIDAWSDQELNALCIQWVAGDMREASLDVDEPDWDAYEKDAQEGRCSSRIFKTGDKIYFSLD